MLPRHDAPRLTATMRATLAAIAVRPARRVRGGWRKANGTRISMKTALALFRAGLVERVVIGAREILRPTTKGFARLGFETAQNALSDPRRAPDAGAPRSLASHSDVAVPGSMSGAGGGNRWQERADLA